MITVGEIIIMLRQKRMMLIRMALKTITIMALRMMKMMWMMRMMWMMWMMVMMKMMTLMIITLQGRRQLHVVARCSVAASYSPALLTLPATK